MKTLLLDRDAWDLVLDANGNIALASDPYAIAQDVASAVKTFLGECWYDQAQGIPYWQRILGQDPPISLIKEKIEARAKTVHGVVTAEFTLFEYENRVITGKITITDKNSNTQEVII